MKISKMASIDVAHPTKAPNKNKSLTTISILAALLTISFSVNASLLPADGTDTVYALGKFELLVGGNTLPTPLLFDSTTVIQHTQDPSNPNSLVTQILNSNMQASGYFVNVGTDSSLGTPESVGQVQSINGNQTLPATGNFNIYANVISPNLPAKSFLYNPLGNSLKFTDTTIDQYPGVNIFTYSSPAATAIYLHNDGESQDTLFGYLLGGVIETIPNPTKANITLFTFQLQNNQQYTDFNNITLDQKQIIGTAPSVINSSYATVPVPGAAWLFFSIVSGWKLLSHRKTAA